MSPVSLAIERISQWVGAEDADQSLATFRRVFAGVWLLYDAIDLVWGTTERSLSWFPHARDWRLAALQVVLVASGLMLVVGKRIWMFGMAAAAARATEALEMFPLNDFYFCSIVYALIAHSGGGPFAEGRRPKWVHDALLVEFAWVYLATGVLKLNRDWLSGGHLFVRTQYLVQSQDWPFPLPVERALRSLPIDGVLATVGAALEILLSGVMFARRPYRLGVTLAVAIHGAGALITNVWFFSASMIAGVALLLPRAHRAKSLTDSRLRPPPRAASDDG